MIAELKSRVEVAFARIAARMAGLPACNPGLQVELVGLCAWEGLYLGVLVTPWTVSLMLLPGERELPRLGADERERWQFASGEYEFMGGHDDLLGHFHSCSLISPPLEFASQEEARAVALAALYALREPADNTAFERQVPRKPLSRRGFLTGGLFEHQR